MIFIVLLLLALCVAVDYATNDTTVTNMDQVNDSVLLNDSNVINGTYYVNVDNGTKVTTLNKVVVTKPKYPVISMWAKPSVRSSYAYRWYKKTFIDYCPHCHHYKVLLKNPKGVPEREYTCRHCGADYCAVTGKEKYSWSHYYLMKA
jgi:hypothetical protein